MSQMKRPILMSHFYVTNVAKIVYIDYTYPFGSYLMGQSNMERNNEIICSAENF